MSRKLIPISKKQHDAINGEITQMRLHQQAIQQAAALLVLGQEDEIAQFGVVGTECVDGIYSLVLELPDIAPKGDEAVA